MAELDFKLLFERAPGLFLVLSPNPPEFTILGASDAYLGATLTRRSDITGRGLFEVFPDNPDDPSADGTSNLRASLMHVVAEREPHVMAVQKYDIRRPQSKGGGFEERFWSPVNSPVIAEGRLSYIVHRVEDVTEFVTPARENSDAMQARMKSMELEILNRSRELDAANKKLAQRVDKGRLDLAEAEERLRHAQKMEAVGRLAGGVAHDFNNLVSVIIGYAEFAHDEAPEGSQLRADIAEIREAGERAADLTRQLLAFSRKQVLQPTVLDVNDAVARMDKLLQRLIGEDVDLVTRLNPGSGRTRADPGQLEQIIVNLAVNARDAMPEGGKLRIETGRVELDESYVADHPGVTPGPYVFIAISDTGVGMDAETRAKIFEPFYTTKKMGRGTGLGLSTVYGIVKQSGGAIWVYSEPGRGTTFKIYLPEVADEAAARRTPAPRTDTRGSETILVVEDEPGVRRLVRKVLEKAGYEVLMAEDGEQALKLYDEHRNGVAMLLSDVVLPGMGGPAIVKALHERDASLRVLFMSGYTDDAIVYHGVLDEGVNYIEKPLRPDALLAKIREVLA